MTAWKKHNPYRSFLKADGLAHESKNSLLLIGSVRNDAIRLDFSPLGCSFVILMPDCNTDAGKSLLGYDVSHKRKSGLRVLALLEISSTIFYKVGIQVTAK